MPQSHDERPVARSARFNPIRFARTAIRNSPWVVIAIVAHVILVAVMSIIYVKGLGAKADDAEPTTVAVSTRRAEENEPPPPPPEVIDRKAIPKNDEAEIVTYEQDVFIPSNETPSDEDLSKEVGDPTADPSAVSEGFSGGTAIGMGTTGHAGTGRPSGFSGRRVGSGRVGHGRKPGGPTQGTEKAVLEGLRWLLRHQNDDGSWSAEGIKKKCQSKTPCVKEGEYTTHYDEGLTGLALLCFLGAGYSHDSKQNIVDTVTAKRYYIGESVKKGLQWLVARQKADGSFCAERPFMYNEALATLAICEAYGLTQSRAWKGPAQKAVAFLQNSQKPSPSGKGLWGWRYASRLEIEGSRRTGTDEAAYLRELHDADTSVTAWVVMALKSAALAGLDVSKESLDGAMEYCKWVSKTDGLVGYTDPDTAGAFITGINDHFNYHTATMSALGMCIRTFAVHDLSDPFLESGAKQLLKDLPKVTKDNLSIDYYYWYYGSLALNQLDGPDSPKKTGKYWGPWNKAMQEVLLQLQNEDEKSCGRGGWLTGDRWSYAGGPIYNTAINTLTLQVYYRYENAFGSVKDLAGPGAKGAADPKGKANEAVEGASGKGGR